MDTIVKMASEQSFSLALLVAIAAVLWRTMLAQMAKKDAKYDDLENKFRALEAEFRNCIQKHQDDTRILMQTMQDKYSETMVNQNTLMKRSSEALEANTHVLEAILPVVKKLQTG